MSSIRAATHTFNAAGNTSISIGGSNDLDLVLTANNKEGIRVDSNGRVGLGISTPNANLHVVGTAIITSNLIVNGNTLVIDAISNEVGIGILNPTANLHVIGTANITSNVVTGNLNVIGAANITGDIRDSKGDVRDIPINNQTSPYILTLADTGKTVAITTGNVFVPNAIFSAGQAVSVYNNSAASITVTQNTSVTMYLAGTATTGNRTLAQRGVATVVCVAANTFVISGAGLT